MRYRLVLPTFLLFFLMGAPAFAQIDLSGEWAPRYQEDQAERIPGPEIADYLGLPISDSARMRGEIWDSEILTVPEHQCKPHPSDYGIRGPAQLRIWKEVDHDTQQLIAFHTHIAWMSTERTIYMDGRPHPPEYAAHTWQGFSTGKWDGNVLTVTTTHLKIGWIRRNGIPRSDRATVTEHFIRHGDRLTVVTVVDDPVYLTEPFIRSTDFAADPAQQVDGYPCESVEEIVRPKGQIPHYLPGTNPYLSEFSDGHKIPALAARGGVGTMYPEYRAKLSEPAKFTVDQQTGPQRGAPVAPPPGGEIQILPVSGNVYMLVGAGGNTALQVGKEGVLVVDTQQARLSAALLAAIRKLSDKPIRYIVNTSADADHTGANADIAKAGRTVTGGNVASAAAAFPATIIAHEKVVTRMRQMTPTPPSEAWPNDQFRGDEKDVYLNGEAIQILHQSAAHSDGDSILFFRKSDVIAAGEVFVPYRYPVIDVEKGGGINGEVDALNRIIDLTVPADKQEGGTMVIPGHGRLCDEADVVEYRDMMTIVRDRIQSMKKQGMTLDQVKAAKPTRDYDPLYGPSDQLIEAAYRSL